jgi:hypothetical protein
MEEGSKGKTKEKENIGIPSQSAQSKNGDSTPRNTLLLSQLEILEQVEGNLEESEEKSQPKETQTVTQKKVGRKSNRKRRENEVEGDKELGIQTTLEGILKKDIKQRKGHGQIVKSVTQYQPSKGGASKTIGK